MFQESHGKPEQCTLKIVLDKLLKAQELRKSGWMSESKILEELFDLTEQTGF